MKLQVDDLMMKGLVVPKDFLIYNQELTLLKYHNSVFYNNLWGTDSRLLECRGTIINDVGNVVVLPFRKVFNLGENGTKVSDDTIVTSVVKMNGFMACYTNLPQGPLVSTTGSINSKHSEMAARNLDKYKKPTARGVTFIFEICDESDPHIVYEKPGAYLIGMRWHLDGSLSSEHELDNQAKKFGWMRPQWCSGPFKQVLRASGLVKHEGFMIRSVVDGTHLCKLKSPHYLSKKAIMRLGKSKVEGMFQNPENFKQRIDEEFYELVDQIVEDFKSTEWALLPDQIRRTYIESYFAKKCKEQDG